MKVSAPLKVGILTITALIILITTIFWIKGRSLGVGEYVKVAFHDVDGLRAGASVQMMGIRIGQVDSVIPVIDGKNNRVEITFIITDPTVKIPKGSEISIQQSGIIGEKFMEIMPPTIKNIKIPLISKNTIPTPNAKVYTKIQGELFPIGTVKNSSLLSLLDDEALIRSFSAKQGKQPYTNLNSIDYVIDRTDISIPPTAKFTTIENGNNVRGLLISLASHNEFKLLKEPPLYRVIEPLRLMDFLILQSDAAKSLKETNDKINLILENESITVLRETLVNVKDLTESAENIFEKGNKIITSLENDFKKLLDSSTVLTENFVSISGNMNELVGNEQLKKDIIATINSIQLTTDELSKAISDPNLKKTIANTEKIAQQLADLTAYVNETTKETDLKGKLNETLNNFNTSLNKLTVLLEKTDHFTESNKADLDKMFQDSQEVSANLKKFSDKLNKKFLLFRLMF